MEDTSRIVPLLKKTLGESSVPKSEEIWNYKHHDNPFGPSKVLVAEVADRIVGVRAFMRWTWQRGQQRYAAFRAVDTATDPEFQGQGIFKRLTMQCLEELAGEPSAFVFNTPNEQSRPGYLKMGWQEIGRIPVWLSPRLPSFGTPHPASPQGGEELGDEGSKAAESPDPLTLPSPRRGEELGNAGISHTGGVESEDEGKTTSLSTLAPLGRGQGEGEANIEVVFPSVLNELCEQFNQQSIASGQLFTPRSPEYLAWRYEQNPLQTYQLGNGGNWFVAVYAKPHKYFRELRVAEWLVEPGSRAAQRKAAGFVRSQAKRERCHVISSAGPIAGLPQIRTSRGPRLTTRNISVAPEDGVIGDLDAWHYQLGELELF